MVYVAVRNNGHVLEFESSRLQNHKEIVLAAVNKEDLHYNMQV